MTPSRFLYLPCKVRIKLVVSATIDVKHSAKYFYFVLKTKTMNGVVARDVFEGL